eukprot:295680-Pelagomonas_calceolata.AAC.2
MLEEQQPQGMAVDEPGVPANMRRSGSGGTAVPPQLGRGQSHPQVVSNSSNSGSNVAARTLARSVSYQVGIVPSKTWTCNEARGCRVEVSTCVFVWSP